MNFAEAEQHYQKLLQQWRSGQLSPDQFNRAVAELRVSVADGSWWTIRAEDGAWMHRTPQGLVEAMPPRQAPAAPVYAATQPAYQVTPAPPPRKKRGFWKGCFLTLFWLIVIVAILAGAGYWAVQTGRISLIQVGAMVTGVGEISVVNSSDGVLQVVYTRLDTEDGVPAELDSQSLASFDIGGRGGMEPGRYRLDFSGEADQPSPHSCSLRLGRNDTYTFVATPQGIAVVRQGQSGQSAAELNVQSSSLCQQ